MDLRSTYDAIMDIQFELQSALQAGAFFEMKKPWDLRSPPDYKVIHAMSATFTLQDYLANEIAKNESKIAKLEEQLLNLDQEKDIRYIKKIREEIDELRKRTGEEDYSDFEQT